MGLSRSWLSIQPGAASGWGIDCWRGLRIGSPQPAVQAVVIDTSSQAVDLLAWYGRQGYEPVGTWRWSVTNYDSIVLRRPLPRAGGLLSRLRQLRRPRRLGAAPRRAHSLPPHHSSEHPQAPDPQRAGHRQPLHVRSGTRPPLLRRVAVLPTPAWQGTPAIDHCRSSTPPQRHMRTSASTAPSARSTAAAFSATPRTLRGIFGALAEVAQSRARCWCPAMPAGTAPAWSSPCYLISPASTARSSPPTMPRSQSRLLLQGSPRLTNYATWQRHPAHARSTSAPRYGATSGYLRWLGLDGRQASTRSDRRIGTLTFEPPCAPIRQARPC